ncbi:MAG: (2Fe-2S)-binding protein [Planctomycetes bacterium]|nr:(2Fe-2S)-binding protein [Planctomycetota bacterium]
MAHVVSFELNGRQVSVQAEPWARLIDVLRGPLGHTGTKEGCGEGECGACTVLVDGAAINSCLFPVLEVEGRSVTTIEGLRDAEGRLAALQEAFVEEGGVQCGFCSPGMILTAAALLLRTPHPTEAEIREELAGNLCRCTGYAQIVEAVQAAATRAPGREERGA